MEMRAPAPESTKETWFDYLRVWWNVTRVS